MYSGKFFSTGIVVTGLLFFSLAAFAKAPVRTSRMEAPSGLLPVFPAKARCVEISSPYGSRTRYDGSKRPTFRFGGRHGGIDLSLAENTPLLAVAGGTVISKGEGSQMEGIYLWLRHPPEETGLPYWIYSKYQHLNAPPILPIGAKVAAGQVVAYSGKTGTTGGYYGVDGYPHLHLSILKSPQGKYKLNGSFVMAPDSTLIDPLWIYFETTLIHKDPTASKTVIIPYMSADGRISPQNARVVWPVACR